VTALACNLEAVEMPSPMTSQLAAGLVGAAGSRVAEVRITPLAESTFYAVVIVEGPAGRADVDARPSDALNGGLACRAMRRSGWMVRSSTTPRRSVTPPGSSSPLGPPTWSPSSNARLRTAPPGDIGTLLAQGLEDHADEPGTNASGDRHGDGTRDWLPGYLAAKALSRRLAWAPCMGALS